MTSTLIDRLAGISEGLAVKAPCRVATTANITLSGLQTIDGVLVADGDRVLVKNQTTGSQNGIYTAAATAWTRALDFDGSRDVIRGTRVYITDGTTQTKAEYFVSSATPVIGTDAITFSQADAAVAAAASAALAAASAAVQASIITQYAQWYPTWAIAAAATIPNTELVFMVQRYDSSSRVLPVPFKRIATQPTHNGKIRTTDRFLPNGTTDNTNGGWWELDVDIPTPAMFGAKLDASINSSTGTDDTATVQSCVDYAKAKATRIDVTARVLKHAFDPGESIRVDGPVTIPYNVDVFTDARGAVLLCRPGTAPAAIGTYPYVFDRMPPDLTTAENTAVAHKWIWNGGTIYGVVSWGRDFLRCGGSYGSRFQDMLISGFHNSIRVEFGLKTVVDNVFFEKLYGSDAAVSGIGLYLGEGSWVGANASNSQSNRSTVRSCHFSSITGQTLAALWINQSSGCSVYESVFEGGNPVNNIVYNNTDIYGKDFYISGAHFESVPTNAHVLITTNGGTVTLDRLMPVDGGAAYVVDDTGSTGGVIVVGDIPDPNNIGKFRHQTATGTKWWFNSKEFAVQTTAKWDTGAGYTMPDTTHLFHVGMDLVGDFKLAGDPDFPDGFKIAGSGYGMKSCFKGDAATTLGPLAAGATVTATVTVTGCGVLANENAYVTYDTDLLGITYTARVSAADTVTIRFTNGTSASHTLGAIAGTAVVTRIA